MATLGSLTVRFAADISALSSGVDDAASAIGKIGEAISDLQKKIAAASSQTVSITVDTKSIEDASKSLDSLKGKAESASTQVAVSATSSGVEELGESIDAAGESAVRSRSSLASLVVTSAAVVGAANQAVRAYSEFRDGLVGYIQAATGARTATSAVVATYRGLRGDLQALRAVFGGVRAGVEGVVSSFLSAENINRLLVSTLGATMRMFGATDEAVVASSQVLAGLVTQQIATASSHRLVQRSLQVLGSAYDSSTESLARFLTQTATGRRAGELLSDGLLATSRAAVQVDATINSLVSSVNRYLTSGRLIGAVSAATGSAFDAVAAAARGLLVGTTPLGSSLAAVQLRASLLAEGLLSLLPTTTQAAAAFGRLATFAAAFAGPALSVVSSLSNVASGLGLVATASREGVGFLDFTAAVAQSAALTASFGAMTGAATAAVSGTGILSGAMAGATSAVAGLVATFPLVIAGAVAAAVAVGKVESALRHVGENAEMLGNLSDRFGQSVQEIEKLKIAAEQSGVALQSVVRAQQTFSQNMSKVKIGQLGTPQAREAKAAFDRLGISAEDMRSAEPEEVLREVAKAMSEIPDAAKRTQLAMDIFGRTGPQILPLLKNLEQLEDDIGRLGGTISDLDFERFAAVDQSFDRLATASGALTDDLAIPFTRMGEAWNNARAEIIGGLAPLVGALSEVIADISTPFAVAIEIIGRVVGSMLRLTAAVAKAVTAFLPFATLATLAELIGDAFNALWSIVEAIVETFEEFATAAEEAIRPTVEGFVYVGEVATEFLNTLAEFAGLGEDLFGPITTSLIALATAYFVSSTATQVWSAVMATSAGVAIRSAVLTAASWIAAAAGIVASLTVAAVVIAGVYVASVLLAAATTIASCAAMHVAWLFGLGPIGLLVAGVELLGVGIVALYALGSGIAEFFSGWFAGEEAIDGATASAEQLAEVVAEREEPGMVKDIKAIGEAAGFTQEEVETFIAEASEAISEITGVEIDFGGDSIEKTAEAIAGARDRMGELSIRAAQLGSAGASAAAASTEEFDELQRSLAEGSITMEDFTAESARVAESLDKNLQAIAKGSPEETLKKNIELFGELDKAAQQAAKTVREIGAGIQIGDKFFPRSSEVKARAKQYSDEYSDALDEVKRKLASGGFQQELDARRAKNEADLESGAISEETFQRTKRELDTTSAQEQAAIAAEEIQRELDRKNAKLKVDLDFADGIRKALETAFLSPVEKFREELQKIRSNPELSGSEKDAAELNLRNQARESLIGTNAQTQLQQRQRDLRQGVESGLISQDRADFEGQRAMEEFAKAIGATQTPFEEFSSSLDGIAEKFGMVGVPLDEVRRRLEGTPEQLAIFDRALKESRDKLLASLGIEKTPQQVFDEQMQRIAEAANSSDPNKRITEEQRQQAESAARRQRDRALGAGEGAGEEFAARQARIAEAFGENDPRRAIAENALAMDRRQAAGLDADPSQQLRAGAAKIDDAFNVTGQSLAEIQATLSPEDFAAYQEAQKKNVEAVKASLGVEQTGAQRLADSRVRLDKALADGVISQDEYNKAAKKQKDELLSSLGISRSPAQDFEDSVARIRENAEALTPEELAKGLKEAKDKLIESLGIPRSPADAAAEAMQNLREAFRRGQISAEEFARGASQAKNTLLQALGIPLDPVVQLRERIIALQDAVDKGLITQEEFTRGQDEARRSMLPGSEAESPVAKFKRDMDAVGRAVSEGLISPEDGEQRKKVLQAQLQEDMKPALDRLAPDRRAVESSDVRSKSGVDTFFRILRGNDNPSLKAQLETARNTRLLAEAAAEPDAAPVIANMQGR